MAFDFLSRDTTNRFRPRKQDGQGVKDVPAILIEMEILVVIIFESRSRRIIFRIGSGAILARERENEREGDTRENRIAAQLWLIFIYRIYRRL